VDIEEVLCAELRSYKTTKTEVPRNNTGISRTFLISDTTYILLMFWHETESASQATAVWIHGKDKQTRTTQEKIDRSH